jgi:hypothetical protein
MRTMICALTLIGAIVAAGAATVRSPAAMNGPALSQDGGFGRGYGPFHTYGWARGMAGYGSGACYWHPGLCETPEE